MAEEFIDGEAGFSQTIDRQRHVLELRVFGFFSDKLTAELLERAGAAMRALPRPWYFLLRCEELLPQNTAGQEALRNLLVSAGSRGMRRGVIITPRSLAKLQLHRLLRESRARDTESWAFFETEDEALTWLLRPQPSRPPFSAEAENDAIIGAASASIDTERVPDPAKAETKADADPEGGETDEVTL